MKSLISIHANGNSLSLLCKLIISQNNQHDNKIYLHFLFIHDILLNILERKELNLMGLFNGYLKEGPGVEKDAPKKHRFFLFFELFGRKFSKLIILNLLYFLTLIPFIIGAFATLAFNPEIFVDGVLSISALQTQPLIVLSGDIVGMIILFLSLFILGPSTAGFTYVIRNFQREQHAWVASDFYDHFKKNFKQGSIVAIIDAIVYLLIYVAFVFYAYMAKDISPEMAQMSPILLGAVGLFAIIYTWMHYYIYVMMVTFDLSVKDIMRNAFLFALAKFPLNIFITIVCGAIIFLSVYYSFVGIILAIIITLSLLGYIIVFSVYPTIDNYLITPSKQMSSEKVNEMTE